MGIRADMERLGAELAEAERPIPTERPCVHCFRPTSTRPGVRVVCPGCRDTEAALNGGPRPAVQVAFGVTRPPGLQPWWTPAEDRVLAQCRTAAEAHDRLPWRTKAACAYRFKTLRHAGRLPAFATGQWTPAEDAVVCAAVSTGDCHAAAARLGRTIVAVWRRRGELRRAGAAVTRLPKGRPPNPGA